MRSNKLSDIYLEALIPKPFFFSSVYEMNDIKERSKVRLLLFLPDCRKKYDRDNEICF